MQYFVKNDPGGSCSGDAGSVANDVVVASAKPNEKANEIDFIKPEQKTYWLSTMEQ